MLRILVAASLPYAYYHDDAPDFLVTADRLMTGHGFELHPKKTFLVPFLYSLPFALPFPAAVIIPLFQNLLGLGLVLMFGVLCRLWLRAWKIWIIPLTTLLALNPFLLWYERVLMAETIFVFCTMLVPLTAILYARWRDWKSLVLLAGALVLAAGARPEGKLLFGFGLLLVLLLHRQALRVNLARLLFMASLALAAHFCTKTSQAGLLLYTSVARLTPVDLRCAPGFDPFIRSIRQDFQKRWEEHPQYPSVADRKEISQIVKNYLASKSGQVRIPSSRESNAFCFKLARETCLRNLSELPGLVLVKFRLTSSRAPAELFDARILFAKQMDAFKDDLNLSLRLSPGLLGVQIKGEADLEIWIREHYRELPWFNSWSGFWLKSVNFFHLPDQTYSGFIYPGVPFYFILGFLGLLMMMLKRGEGQVLHVAWGLFCVFFFFVIMLTANVRPRFRLVFEPFWFLYAALLIEGFWSRVRARGISLRNSGTFAS